MEVDNTTLEGIQEILKRFGMDINQITFSYHGGPETIFIPNEAFPKSVRPVTTHDGRNAITVSKTE